jgi:hypothetical protein
MRLLSNARFLLNTRGLRAACIYLYKARRVS